ncbi:hypothetical protein OS493_024545 [Desmophyllum pertusum]|uniref:Uncharacterized protein n=1 Tax=Desmophyllum pertusum TaxID=174260 RepID=A0A9W9ZZ33_9CNID|nr:hypothetical protein OS493_024545 [Desmophyllum pertusum]
MSASSEFVPQNAEKAPQLEKCATGHAKENPMTCAAEMRTVPAAFSLVETMTVPRVIGGCSVKGHHGVPDKDEI